MDMSRAGCHFSERRDALPCCFLAQKPLGEVPQRTRAPLKGRGLVVTARSTPFELLKSRGSGYFYDKLSLQIPGVRGRRLWARRRGRQTAKRARGRPAFSVLSLPLRCLLSVRMFVSARCCAAGLTGIAEMPLACNSLSSNHLPLPGGRTLKK